MRQLLIALGICVALSVFAATPPAMPDETKTHGNTLPFISLTRDNGSVFSLDDLKGKPLILNPVFVSCPHTCSPITSSLLKATETLKKKGYDFHVLTFSFDPADSPESIRVIRDRIGLPAEWEVAWGAPDEIAKLLTALDFQVEPSKEAGFLHPNLVAVANADLKLEKYVFGVQLHADELELALIEAVRKTPWWHQAWKGVLAFCVVSIAVVAFAYYGRRT